MCGILQHISHLELFASNSLDSSIRDTEGGRADNNGELAELLTVMVRQEMSI